MGQPVGGADVACLQGILALLPAGHLAARLFQNYYAGGDVVNMQPQFEEALRAALKLAFEEMNRERVTLDHFTGNQIASHLYLKVGFQYEGVMRHGGKKDGKYIDLHLMSMLRDEYFAKKDSATK